MMDREKEEEAIAFAPIFHKILNRRPLPEEEEEEEEEEEVTSSDSSSEEFEFSFAPNFQGDTELSVEDLADGIFSNGQIRPVYPVSNRKLIEEREVLKELEFSFRRVLIEDDRGERNKEKERFTKSVPSPESYCEWIPKSRSTGGSSSKRWNLMDLVVGRSHSDGKQKFLFLSTPAAAASNTDNVVVEKTKKKKKKVGVREMDMVTAHKLYYGREGGIGERKQQSYLPYRRNLVGFHLF